MQQSTQELLTAFQNLEWFHAVGTPIDDDSVTTVSLWLDALRGLDYLEIVGYQEGTAMEDAVKSWGKGMSRRWKSAVQELRPLARDVVQGRLRPYCEQCEWPRLIEMIADYDISYALLEREFDIPPGFFGCKARWYLQGRLPCGVTPDGDLIVY